MSSRKTASIVWLIYIWFKHDRKNLKYFFRELKWAFKSEYFWHDNFGKYLNRFFICPVFGHKVIDIGYDYQDQPSRHYCFECEKYITHGRLTK